LTIVAARWPPFRIFSNAWGARRLVVFGAHSEPGVVNDRRENVIEFVRDA